MTALDQLTITVRGHPTTQGNKQGFVVTPKGGKPRAIVTEKASSKLHAWRHAVSDEARKAMGDRPALEGPLAIRVNFRLPRPKSHPKTRRTWPTGARSGDADKLARAVLDALTGVVFEDDSQVVELVSTKDYDRGPGILEQPCGAVITVLPAEDEPSVPLFGDPA